MAAEEPCVSRGAGRGNTGEREGSPWGSVSPRGVDAGGKPLARYLQRVR